MNKALLGVSCVVAGFLLAGCDNFKQTIGLEPTAPDEFAVESRAPLTVPPEFDLRPPAPGAPRPQDVNPAASAEQAMNAAGPGKPGDTASSGLRAGGVLGAAPLADQQLDPLSRKLMTAADVSTGLQIEKRETTVLQGVY
jgi:hypothetical protein